MHLDKATVSEKLRRHILGKSTTPLSEDIPLTPNSDHNSMETTKNSPIQFDEMVGPFSLRYHNHKGEGKAVKKRRLKDDSWPDSTSSSASPKKRRGRKPKRIIKEESNKCESIPTPVITSSDDFNSANTQKFQHFRKRMLQQIYKENENVPQTNFQNPNEPVTNIPFTVNSFSPNINSNNPQIFESSKDESYVEKRKKNNEAAKKSRAKRKMIEDGIVSRIAFLENENYELKLELGVLKYQMALLKAEQHIQKT